MLNIETLLIVASFGTRTSFLLTEQDNGYESVYYVKESESCMGGGGGGRRETLESWLLSIG